MTEELSLETYLSDIEELKEHHLTNICGLMKVTNSTLIVIMVIGMQKDTIQENITSSLMMVLTGKSRVKESMKTGHSNLNAIQSQTTNLKEILVNASKVMKNKLMLASIKPTSTSLKDSSSLSLLVWETSNPQEISGQVITASPTDLVSGEENMLMTHQLFPLTDKPETSAKAEKPVPTSGTAKNLIANAKPNSSTEAGSS